MSDQPRVFLVEVSYEKTFRVTIGGPNGTIRLEGEDDADAAEAVVHDYGHLGEAMMPPYITIDGSDYTVETVREVIDAKAA
jgi:hypothetical protein